MPKEQLALSEAEAPALIQNGEGSVLGLLEKTIESLKGPGAESAVGALEKLVSLYERIEDRNAVKAFNTGMVEFQKRCRAIPQNKTARVPTKGGQTFSYSYADINQIRRVVTPILNDLGFTFSLDQEFREGRMHVAFVLSHRDGHSRTSRFSCPEDNSSAASGQQKSGIADTYAARRAMRHALGLIDDDGDTDGATPGGNGDTNKITDDQVASLQALIGEVAADEKRFVKMFDVSHLEDITKGQYAKAISLLEQKRRQR